MKKLMTFFAAALTLGLGGALMAQQIGSVSNGYIEEGNLMRPGNIFKTITMSNRGQNATTCRQACDADSGCNAYTYVQKAANRKPLCYLRIIALPSNARRNHGYTKVVSGTKLSFLPNFHKLTPYPGRAIQGGSQLRSFKVLNEDPIACSRACSQDGNCTSFTYKPRTVLPKRDPAMCTLYKKNGTLTANVQAGYISGSKTRMSVQRSKGTTPQSSNPAIINRDIRPSGPVIKSTPGQTIKLPDEETREENPSLSDDDDGQFPGEMLGDTTSEEPGDTIRR